MACLKAGFMLTVLAALLVTMAPSALAQHGHGGSPTRYESEDRDQWQLPEKVVALLEIKEGMTVADIGSSSGYFSRRFSAAVGSSGHVLAVDLDKKALQWLAAKAKELGLGNIKTILAEPDNPHLPNQKVDLVFFCNTLHHIGNRIGYLEELKGSLAPGARVAVVDFLKKELPVGPRDIDHKLSRRKAYNAIREAGYRVLREPQGLPYQYFIIARPE
jgi:arsenite methyltransferase